MSLPISIVPAARRRRRRRGVVLPAGPAPLAVTSVTDVSVTVDGLECRVHFDTTSEAPLVDVSSADPAKWTARYDGLGYNGSYLEKVAEDALYLVLSPAGGEAGPDVLNYANNPSDISDTLGRMLAAFSGMEM